VKLSGTLRIPASTQFGGVEWILVLLFTVGLWRLSLGEDFTRSLPVHGGKAIYEAACVACHGAKGEGTPTAGFDKPGSFPHFDKCDESVPEFTRDYKAAIRDGGPARGFSPIMPSFSGVLSSSQIDEVIVYIRSLW
jgi:mono/diheme cytochrome c family protein